MRDIIFFFADIKNYVPNFLKQREIVILCLFPTMGPQFYSFLTMEKYNVLLPSQLCCFFRWIIYRENPAKIRVWEKNPPKYTTAYIFNRATAGGTVNLHVSQVWLQQWKVYSHPPSSICPFPISPSLIPPSPKSKPSVSSPRSVWWLKHTEWLLTILSLISKERDKKYRGFYFLYRYGDFTLYFLSRSFAVRERIARYCEKRPDFIT